MCSICAAYLQGIPKGTSFTVTQEHRGKWLYTVMRQITFQTLHSPANEQDSPCKNFKKIYISVPIIWALQVNMTYTYKNNYFIPRKYTFQSALATLAQWLIARRHANGKWYPHIKISRDKMLLICDLCCFFPGLQARGGRTETGSGERPVILKCLPAIHEEPAADLLQMKRRGETRSLDLSARRRKTNSRGSAVSC